VFCTLFSGFMSTNHPYPGTRTFFFLFSTFFFSIRGSVSNVGCSPLEKKGENFACEFFFCLVEIPPGRLMWLIHGYYHIHVFFLFYFVELSPCMHRYPCMHVHGYLIILIFPSTWLGKNQCTGRWMWFAYGMLIFSFTWLRIISLGPLSQKYALN
jgi:hypothetical protein